MAVFSVDSEAIQSAQLATTASMERVRAEVATLLANLIGLQGSWSGAASSAFQQQVEMWRATQQMVDQSLDGISVHLSLSAHAYAETEQAVLSSFR